MLLQFSDENHFHIGDIRFRLDTVPGVTTQDEVFLYKDRQLLDKYVNHLASLGARNALELGIFQGGSAVLLTAGLGLDHVSCVDICDPLPEFDAFLRRHGLDARVHRHYNTSQDDAARLTQILDTEFGPAGPDLIIDDASHLYEFSRRSFEIAFPRLRKGGYYVLEDWAWAHWPHTQDPSSGWGQWNALTNLVFELVMALGSTGLIEKLEVHPSYVVIRKSFVDYDWTNFSLDSVILCRGRPLVKI